MKDNYKAWRINFDDFHDLSSFQDKLRFLIKFGILAPSSHNSQPWLFQANNNAINILIEKKRMLPVSDHNNRQLYISLGCALENIAIAANYYGLMSHVSYLPTENIALKITFTDKENREKDKSHLIFSILTRATNRNPYSGAIPADFTRSIKELESEDLKINIITDKKDKDIISDVVVAAIGDAMTNADFRKELSGYIVSSITNSKIGMPGSTLLMPLPVSFIASFIIKHINMSRVTQKKDEKLLKEQTPAFVVISSKNDNSINWIKAGQLYQRIALMTEKENMKSAIMAAAIQIGNYHTKLQDVLKTTFRPQVFMRLGYSSINSPHSPRMDSAEVTN